MTHHRSALIVGSAPSAGGEAHYSRLITDADLLVAADGGLRLCLAAGRVPDVCVGDFDSASSDDLEQAARSGAEIIRYPAVKDDSDLDLALSVARHLQVASVRLTAAYAGRLDHTLAALGTLVSAIDLHAIADEPRWWAFALSSESTAEVELTEPVGTVLSVIALGESADVSLQGVRYPLEPGTLPPFSSLGLSNVATAPTQRIEILSGVAVVMVNRANPGETLQ
ncbi:MAG: thiamine diphosphokinase [Coriobacteriia bacterium]|nr:thiamine diphosphokinase [Coriobacteriia bacterium]